jgi:hypothetical protein
MHDRMQAALAEMSIDDASKDLDDDVEFVDVKGMIPSNPRYEALIFVQRRKTFSNPTLKARTKKLHPRWLQVIKRCRMKRDGLGRYARAISWGGSWLRDILPASEI